jgi:CheY-like chemotaxis protein
MPTKTALIVDDSKTAQFKLKRILQAYDLRIDLAYSAEDALSYLSYRIPDIIFMDHSMRGMNGLEAVKIIKANRATATIPVAMYTDESGDDYVERAREAGAIDVLSKAVMTENDIDRTVKSIGATPKSYQSPPVLHDEVDAESHPSQHASDSLFQVRDQVAKSLEIHQGHVRREIQDNTRVMLGRFMRELREIKEQITRDKSSAVQPIGDINSELDTTMAALSQNQPPQTTPRLNWQQIAIGALAAVALISLIGNYQQSQENKRLQAQTTNLIDLVSQIEPSIKPSSAEATETVARNKRDSESE